MVGANSNNLAGGRHKSERVFHGQLLSLQLPLAITPRLMCKAHNCRATRLQSGKASYDSVAITGGIGVDNIYLDSSYTPDNTTLVIDRDDRLVFER